MLKRPTMPLGAARKPKNFFQLKMAESARVPAAKPEQICKIDKQ
jgi:hypothetical protein